MELLAPLAAPFAALVLLLVGRTVLSILPSGRPGGHGPGSIAATAAASLLLGAISLGILDALFEPASLLVLLAPFGLLAAGRVLLLPGSLVPGHGVRHDRAPALTRWSLPVSALALLLLFPVSPGAPPWNWLAAAALVLVDHALEADRRAPTSRALLLPLLATSLLFGGRVEPGLLLASAFLIPWLRRADRRSAWLAALGCAGIGLEHGGAPIGLAALLVLLLASRPAQRRDALRAALLPAAFLLLRLLESPGPGFRLTLPEPSDALALGVAATVLLSLLPGSLLAHRAEPDPFDPEPRLLAGLGALLLARLALAGCCNDPGFTGTWPLTLLLFGALWLSPEAEARPDPPRPFPPRRPAAMIPGPDSGPMGT